jgi:hypothetical protein
MRKTRRKLIQTSALGGIALLSGCSALGMGAKDSKLSEISDPEDSAWVSDGELQVKPYIESYMITDIDSDTASVEMLIMPNPVDDYKLTVHATPLDEFGDGWETTAINYDNHLIYEEDNWNSEKHGVNSALPQYTVNGHGDKIAEMTIPAKSAGLSSGQVSLPNAPELYDELKEFRENRPATIGIEEKKRKIYMKLKSQMDIPSIGDRYRSDLDIIVEDISETERERLRNESPIGGYLKGPGIDEQVTTYTMPPYIVDFDIEGEIPMYKPFVLTFSVHDENSVATPDDVIAQTPQCMRVGEEDFVFPTRGIHEVWENGLTGSFGLYYKPQSWVDVERPYYNTYEDGNKPDLYDSTDVYHTTKEEKENSNKWTVTRATNFGRFSNRLEIDSDFLPYEAPPFKLCGLRQKAYLDSPIQNLWSAEYEISEDQVENLSVDASNENPYHNYTRNEEVQNHPVVQDVASQLSDVCDRIGATQPIEKIRVVADFVQYFTHRDEGTGVWLSGQYPPGYNLRASLHPVRTLYNAEGDCVSFTLLANTILRTEHFGFDPDIAHIEDSNVFTADGREVGHVSTGIPFSQLEIDDVSEAHNTLMDPETSEEYYLEKYTLSDAQYYGDMGKTLYVELSGEIILGATKSGLVNSGIESY